MKKEELKLILKEGEGQYIEFKESFDPKSLTKEIIAFANATGGKIFLGINDNNEITGIDNITNKLKSQIQDIANHCDPSIQIDLEKIENILIIYIKEGKNKPYSCKNGFYIRVGPNSQKMKRDDIIEIIRNNSQFSFDNSYIKTKQSFNAKKFDNFLKKWDIISDLNQTDILRSMNLTNENKKFSNASILLFGSEVQQDFPPAYLECVLFKDREGVNIIDRKRINGDLFEQLNEGMIFMKKHIKVKYEFPDEKRREIYDVPLRALEEALVNAIIHRDYSFKGANISLFIYSDRIEILSPGGLAPGFEKNEFGKISIRRNELIADMFSKTNYVEKIGSGIGRMKNLCEEQGNDGPQFDINNFFIISFSFQKVPQKVPQKIAAEARRNKIIQKIKNKKKFTKRSLAEEFGVDTKTVNRDLEELKSRIEFIGSKKGGHWKLK